jgi:hypothetical protein
MPLHSLSRPHLPTSNVIPASDIRLGAEPVALFIPGQRPCNEPRVNLIRDGDVVRAIEVICTCGERVVLTCVY